MTTKINAKTTKATLTEQCKDDAALLKDVGQFLSFAAFLSTGNPLGLLAAIELIVKTAGSTISTGITLSKRLFAQSAAPAPEGPPAYERFRILYYLLCQRCFIEAIEETVGKINSSEEASAEKITDESISGPIKKRIKERLATLEEAEVRYMYCVEPLGKEVPLFNAYGLWLASLLESHGIGSSKAINVAADAEKEARQRFRVYLAQDDPETAWMRNYLALSYQEEASTQLANLTSIREALDHWRMAASEQREQHDKDWANYRETLRSLPDKKETMFNESFGVRKVFLRPAATYHVRGAGGDTGALEEIPDVGRLIGALISTRVPGDDLIILCGGPGSGKSTLCRMVASELAGGSDFHPVFLRLRRAKDGAEIKGFIEESLREEGLISRLADLRHVPNLVLILDGFDELVAASRSRLRHFFNVLQEDVSTGPLKNARVIVSGRDTLFPNGEGLPYGSHVISLVPFDQGRVTLWGEKWRSLHDGGIGATFHPETFLDPSSAGKFKPLHHLVSWPLTLHLVARVHTAGRLTLDGKEDAEIPKAYLYRSILAESANRQTNQVTETPGRLAPDKMRSFLRLLAWEMYATSTDTLDPSDVMRLLPQIDGIASKSDLTELADTAILNAPELKKGEDTGFEFVHKSFAEYLVAEHLADLVERVTFQVQDYGTDEMTWRMSSQEAASQLAPAIGIRPITEEVQDMLEPMLGGLADFLKGSHVAELVQQPRRLGGLNRIVERFEALLEALLQGEAVDTVNLSTKNKPLVRSPFEAFANYCLGLLIIGCSAARQVGKSADGQSTFFQAEQTRGAFWRCLSILQAGGITIDKALADRILSGLTVRNNTIKDNSVGDLTLPFKLGELARIDGYIPYLTDAIRSIHMTEDIYSMLTLILIEVILCLSNQRLDSRLSFGYGFFFNTEKQGTANRVAQILSDAGMLSDVSFTQFIRGHKAEIRRKIKHISLDKNLFRDIYSILQSKMKDIGIESAPSIVNYFRYICDVLDDSKESYMISEEVAISRLVDIKLNFMMNEDD